MVVMFVMTASPITLIPVSFLQFTLLLPEGILLFAVGWREMKKDTAKRDKKNNDTVWNKRDANVEAALLHNIVY